MRGTALIAVVKDLLVYITVLAAIIIIPAELGGYGKIFAAVPAKQVLLPPAPPGSLGAGFAYVTLALGSLLALFLYPHSVTGLLSSSSRHVDPQQCHGAARLFGGAGAASRCLATWRWRRA